MIDWPLVDPNDDGIRPAGAADECFYCFQRVGSEHARDCTIVTKRVEMRIDVKLPDGTAFAGSWIFNEPHDWDTDMSEFHKNESTWCAGNLFRPRYRPQVTWDRSDAWELLAPFGPQDEHDNICRVCGLLKFRRVRVVDDTPRRELRT